MAYKLKTTLTGTVSASVDLSSYTPFSVQPDVAVYVIVGPSTASATAANAIKVGADGLYEDVTGTDGNTYVHVIPVSGSMSTKVFTK